jgi:hypothetical protein
MLLLTLLLRVPKPVLKSKSRRARADFVKAENNSPDRESAASDRVLLGALKPPNTRPKRRESVRFPIMRCNLLRSWLLCRLYSLVLLANRRNDLRFGAGGTTNSRYCAILLTH